MATREEKIAFLQSQGSGAPAVTREQKIAFLQSKAAQSQTPAQSSWLDTQLPMDTTPRGLIQGGLDALPTAGMIAGGIMGTPADVVAGPLGNVVGAGIGTSVGQTLKNAGERFILGKEKPNSEVLMDAAKAVPLGMAGEMGGQILGKGLSAAASTKIGQAAISKLGSGAAKVGELFTGIPKSEIETYVAHGPEIDALSKANDHNAQEMADSIREKVNDVIDVHKKGLNEQISKALADKTGEVESQPIISKLESAKAKINSKLRPDEVGEVDDLIGKVNAVSTDDGKMSLQDAHDLKEYLSEAAKGTYKKGGQIFQRGEKAAQAAKAGAAAAREGLNAAAPEVASANSSLSRLHDIEDVMNKNMLTEGKTASPLMAAGSGGNPANAKVLKQLGKETGTDILGEAQKLSAARTFGKPQLMPVDSTGKAVGRMGLASGIGFIAGGPVGAVTAAGATSPAALKVAINTGRAIGTPSAQALGTGAMKAAIASGLKNPDTQTPGVPTPTPINSLTNSTPQKGEKKWMNDGFSKLLEHTDDPADKDLLEKNKSSMLGDPKINQLLIQASDLKPGSKAMDKVMAIIKSKIASGDD